VETTAKQQPGILNRGLELRRSGFWN
jgi:hypothetical protein